MQRLGALIGAGLLVALARSPSTPALASSPPAPSCGLVPLAIEPRAAADPERWVSRARTFTLEHWNSGRLATPRLFPEPLVLVRLDGGRCTLEAGIYSRVWVSADERTLAVDWNGGSESYLELWDVATCSLRDRLRVFAAAYRLDGDGIESDGGCEPFGVDRGLCEPAEIWRLDARCRPRKDLAASRRRTKEKFGVVFDAPSELEHVGTKAVRVVGPAARQN